MTTPIRTEAPSITRGQAVGKVAGLLASEALSAGERAELRRAALEAPFTPALWRVLFYLQDEGAPVRIGDEADERRWATLLISMAHCVDPRRNLHDYQVPLGRALADAGWSELRFTQLLRARGLQLAIFLRRMAQYLSAREQPANWADVAELLFEQTGERADAVRLRIARAYYARRYQQEGEVP
ncbi:type I-E CRISPR-associated protein Cse2/CasB [Rhodothermus profundi]|uniref:CRISPR system Cascade subunit CasB n=1 Tax=Rhodothermus profundi TaxID=633813 RepID=A0A1M6UE80_9BACT|nr:type I-E CRISPR-associated protein Cse2/CasB [Rhodothermus profundi]SHK67514.1 CRISPR system Cascade subunit CasB [Rhodothermus profundi]